MKVGIIGAGITGLTAAYQLKKQGVEVEILEGSPRPYGLAGTFSVAATQLEKYYHHFFTSDRFLQELLQELGLEGNIRWLKGSMGYYSGGNLYDFGTIPSLLRFKALSPGGRLRFATSLALIMGMRYGPRLEQNTAREWLLRYAGREAYEKVWRPLLVSKFGDTYKEISMAWFWGKVKLRGGSRKPNGELLGYLEGSTAVLLDRLAQEIPIRQDCRVQTLAGGKSGLQAQTSRGNFAYDRILSTVPLPLLLEMAAEILPASYVKVLKPVEYTAVSCLVMFLSNSLMPYYWLNIGDPTIPFGGIIEHTNLVARQTYGNSHIVYISHYMSRQSPYYRLNAADLLEAYREPLQRINPSFEKSWVQRVELFRDDYAQPVIKKHYSSLRPDFKTPVPGLYCACACQIYPEDRGMNYAIRDGIRVAGEIGQDL